MHTPVGDIGYWYTSWLWGVPLIALSVVVHVVGLVLIRGVVARTSGAEGVSRARQQLGLVVAIGVATGLVTVLHLLQASLWAIAYLVTRALPTLHEAMLYSVGAMTAYGHAAIFLEPRWQMLGALEALNGLILFGLTTAFLYGMIQRAWPVRDAVR